MQKEHPLFDKLEEVLQLEEILRHEENMLRNSNIIRKYLVSHCSNDVSKMLQETTRKAALPRLQSYKILHQGQ